MRRNWLALLAPLLCLAAACAEDKAKAPKADKPEAPEVGTEAPAIEGPDLDGKKFKLRDYRGKVVMLDFWGHW